MMDGVSGVVDFFQNKVKQYDINKDGVLDRAEVEKSGDPTLLMLDFDKVAGKDGEEGISISDMASYVKDTLLTTGSLTQKQEEQLIAMRVPQELLQAFCR